MSAAAQAAERSNPAYAAELWRQMLPFMPSNSMQYQAVQERAGQLAAGFQTPTLQFAPVRKEPRSDDFLSFVLKTGLSMAFSIFLFARAYDWYFAVAFVLLIFIHEMGHVIANWHYGLKQSAPIFLGYFGAVIFLRENPPNAKVEGVVGIAGPVAGTIGALACFALAHYLAPTMDEKIVADLYTAAAWGCFMNLWNLLPVPPLDGGRTAAAITPWLWAIGIVGFFGVEIGLFVRFGAGSFFGILILLWILQSTFPRLKQTLLHGGWKNPYYKIGWKPRIAIGAVYLGVIAILVPAFLYSGLRLW